MKTFSDELKELAESLRAQNDSVVSSIDDLRLRIMIGVEMQREANRKLSEENEQLKLKIEKLEARLKTHNEAMDLHIKINPPDVEKMKAILDKNKDD